MISIEASTTKSAKGAKKEVEILYRDESYRIMGACFEVYKELGTGFLEAVYQECQAMEFKARAIPIDEKPMLKLEDKGEPLEQTYIPDFLCYGQIILEIKSAKHLSDDHHSQAINYLKATGQPLALLVNFGHYPKIEYERFLNQKVSRISRFS